MISRTFVVTKGNQKVLRVRAQKSGIRYNIEHVEEMTANILDATDLSAIRRIIESGQPADGDNVELTRQHENGGRSLLNVKVS